MRKYGLALITIGALGLSQATKPIIDDRNEVLINWHNDDGERKVFKIDDLEKDDGEERIHSKTLLQKYTKSSSSCSPSCGSSHGSCGSSSNSCSDGGCALGGSCSNYGGDDYGAGCATGYGSGKGSRYGSGYGSGYASGYGSGYGSGNRSGAYGGSGNRSGAFAGGSGTYGALVGQSGFRNNQGSLRGDNGILGTREYNGEGSYDGCSSGKANDLSYQQMCHLLNKDKRDKIKRSNARAYLRNNKAAKDNKNYSNGSQIDKLCKANERDCMIDACDSAKVANGDKRNDNCFANREACRANEMKKSHNLVNCANRKNEHLNMNEKAKDNLHSHKRVVTEFDKLEHFKKCSENCKDAEKGRRARVNKANNVNKNQRSRKGHRTHNSRFKNKNDVRQQRNKDESNYCDKNNKLSNRKYLKNKDICNSNDNNVNSSADAASCANDERKAYSNDCNDENVCKYRKNDNVVDYDQNCRNRNSIDRYNRCNADRQNRDQIYPAPLGPCNNGGYNGGRYNDRYNGGRCDDGYNGGRCNDDCDDTCGDGFY